MNEAASITQRNSESRIGYALLFPVWLSVCQRRLLNLWLRAAMPEDDFTHCTSPHSRDIFVFISFLVFFTCEDVLNASSGSAVMMTALIVCSLCALASLYIGHAAFLWPFCASLLCRFLIYIVSDFSYLKCWVRRHLSTQQHQGCRSTRISNQQARSVSAHLRSVVVFCALPAMKHFLPLPFK